MSWILLGLLAATLAGGGFYLWTLTGRLRDRARELEELKGQMLEWNRRLETSVSRSTGELEVAQRRVEEAYIQTVTALVEAMTAKDKYLFNHSHNVAHFARVIAEEMRLSKNRINRLVHGCELHDLGKIAIPDSILLKNGPLTQEEYEVVKEHPLWGARILEPLTFMRDILEMVHQEHERWDGTGYPQGLKGEQIRLEARIIAVGDALDAMVSDRPYRTGVDMEKACREIRRCAGTQFDPKVAEAALQACEEGRLTLPTVVRYRPHLGMLGVAEISSRPAS